MNKLSVAVQMLRINSKDRDALVLVKLLVKKQGSHGYLAFGLFACYGSRKGTCCKGSEL